MTLYASFFEDAIVAEINPLKQGLKLVFRNRIECRSVCCRDKSTKTRIETPLFLLLQVASFFVAEINPLKQGLKLSIEARNHVKS